MSNNEDLLFTNTFVNIPDSKLPLEGSANNFRKYYETSVKSRKSVELQGIDFEETSRKIEKKTIITIDTKDRDVNQYPLQNDFGIFLGKTFFNVKSIALVSTEIPNTDTVIKELPFQLKNNSIIWINEEDKDLGIIPGCIVNTSTADTVLIETPVLHGIPLNTTRNVLFFNGKKDSEGSVSGFLDGQKEVLAVTQSSLSIKQRGGNPFQGTTNLDVGQPIYNVDIKPGNYTASTLVDQIASTLNKVRRLNGVGQFHYFEVTVNLDTDVILFDSVKLTQLPNNSISTTAASTIITVSSAGHGFKTGDRVKMLGVKNLAGIPGSVLRGDFEVTVVDFNSFTYEITERAIETASGGGNVVKTGKNAPFRLLFNSEDTRIQFNTGFPDEDSSIAINSNNPILTKSLTVSNAVIIGEIIRITTSIAHSLVSASSGTITSITSNLEGGADILTAAPHNLEIPQIIYIRDTNSYPSIDGDFLANPTGPNSFTISSRFIINSGNYGEFFFGGDTIQISGLRTSPPITASNYFHVENTPANNILEIRYPVSAIDNSSVASASVNTEQITVTHPAHGFNRLTLIDSFNSTSAVCKTLLPHSLVGSIRNSLSVVSGPAATNTIDISIPGHKLETSDTITVRNSTCTPSIDGTYVIQVLGLDTVRINFVFATLVPGTCTVVSGDRVSISNSNSIPRINGNFPVSNQELVIGISTGSISVILTLATPRSEWRVGDLINLSNTNCVPSINGEHYILNVLSPTQFRVDIQEVVVTVGTTGDSVNKSRFLLNTNFGITTPGDTGIFGRDQEISFYRIAPEVKTLDNIGGILINSLNARPREILRIIDANTYVIRVKGSYANKTISSGGNEITISSKFHGNRSIQANTKSGDQQTALFRSISLQGEDYLFLSSQGLDTVVNSSGINDVFAKILLNDSPGNMVYNSFITAPKIFQSPISKIDTLRFKMLTSKGYPFNFNDINWSFSLEVIELVDSLVNSEFSSRSNNTEYDGAISSGPSVEKRKSLTRSGKSGSLDTANTQFGILRAVGGRGSAANVK